LHPGLGAFQKFLVTRIYSESFAFCIICGQRREVHCEESLQFQCERTLSSPGDVATGLGDRICKLMQILFYPPKISEYCQKIGWRNSG
jgi:hypothetical protein